MANEQVLELFGPTEIKFGPFAGQFHFTETKRGRKTAIGYCALHGGGHASAAEATACFHKYLRENVAFYAESKNGAANPCGFPGCPKKTSGFARAGISGYVLHLCDDHRNPDGLAQAIEQMGKVTPSERGEAEDASAPSPPIDDRVYGGPKGSGSMAESLAPLRDLSGSGG